jgi:hypothetical protein
VPEARARNGGAFFFRGSIVVRRDREETSDQDAEGDPE